MEDLFTIASQIKEFISELSSYLVKVLHLNFLRIEKGKGVVVYALYRKRGKYARRLIHTGMAGLVATGMMIAPVIAQEFPGTSIDPWEIPSSTSVLSATTGATQTNTLVSEKIRGDVVGYTVQDGDTVASIANKFGVSEDTVRWQNNVSRDKIKIGQELEILPVTGIAHKVQKGDTVYSIAKKYDTGAQGMVDFPYNTFVNDETFQLAIGQTIIVPEGIKPTATGYSSSTRNLITPDAGTVVASGSFVWPTNGKISQGFAWYHKGIDIANKAAPGVLAADSGTVIVAGWPDGYGYGNRVILDHGNGYRTLYAHLSSVYVSSGQTVRRGDTIGKMGSTGRSTGTHLHFEVIRSGSYLSPLGILR